MYVNRRRCLHYALSEAPPSCWCWTGGSSRGRFHLLPAQSLWVNVLTQSLAGTALGAEPAESGTLRRGDRATHARSPSPEGSDASLEARLTQGMGT